MPPQTKNSPSKSQFTPAWIEKGTVVAVDRKNFTVDVVSEYSSKLFTHLQVMSPYFHTNRGEGFSCLPDIMAIVYVCFPSDNDPPFIMGYTGSYEVENSKNADLSEKSELAAVEQEELQPTPSTVSSSSPGLNSVNASARAGRPFLNLGDIYLATRDDNFLILRRGGVVQIGATSVCQSVYLPIRNALKQFCMNYDLTTPGGVLEWVVQQQEFTPEGNAPVCYRLAVRDYAQNDKADVQIKIGHVNSTVRYSIVVAPSNVEAHTGMVSSPVFQFDVENSGSASFTLSGDLVYVVRGSRTTTINGNDTVAVNGQRKFTFGSVNGSILGNQDVMVMGADTLTSTGNRKVNAPMHLFGPPPYAPAILGDELIKWLSSHTHPAPNLPSTQIPALPLILSRKFFVPK
jgi:hypothetical protein